MGQRMKGEVRFCNPVSGVGMVTAEEIGDVFFHVNDLPMTGFKAIVPGKQFEFDLVTSPEGKNQAKKIKLLNGTGITHHDWPSVDRRISLGGDNGSIFLRVDKLGRIMAVDGQPIRPTASGDGYVRAYYVGLRYPGTFKRFTLRLPAPTAEYVMILTDHQKQPRNIQTRDYDGVPPGSYLVSVDSSGQALVNTIGVRHQSIPDQEDSNVQLWIVIHPRFKYQFNLSGGISKESILSQIPTGGMQRDNDGFARAIAVAFQRMAETAQKPARSARV